MKHITNIRELRQMRCEGSELCEVVSIAIGDLERIAEVAEASLRDKFAMAALTGMCAGFSSDGNWPDDRCPDHYEIAAEHSFSMADAMIKERSR